VTSIRDSFARTPPLASIVGKPKIVDNNTFLYETEDKREVVRLHNTDILWTDANGKVTVNTGGWKTVTTKARLNDFLRRSGAGIVSDKGQWKMRAFGMTLPFFDGMVLPDAFAPERLAEIEEKGKAEAKLINDIRKFVKKTIVTGKPLPEPGPGDCWMCSMFDRVEPVESGPQTGGWGSGPQVQRDKDPGHLLSHIEEGYMHGWLIVNAFRSQGYRDQAISYWCYSNRPDYTVVRRIITKYLRKRLGLPT
jgi:hypothetical protein